MIGTGKKSMARRRGDVLDALIYVCEKIEDVPDSDFYRVEAMISELLQRFAIVQFKDEDN